MQHILSLVRKAVDEYGMIDEGDRIAVGCSGGKDSTLLLLALSKLSEFYPKKYSIVGIVIDPGTGMNFSPLGEFCEKENIELIIKRTEIAKIIFDIRKESNPCSLCARMRRGSLNDAALEAGANKVALGHHRDDVIDTFFLSLIHESRLNTFQPVTYLSRKDIEVIRPMVFVPEKDIKKTVRRYSLPVIENPCPANGNTEREAVKHVIANIDSDYKGIRERIFGAIERSNLDGWKKTGEKDK
ncbi:MAG: tRNA 2-thiocytidine biosynthesis protein TtcA [Clostridia bacterium]|nr:tRNA 2-thiocytidine biosynthesis protein TtcA [Clostridia bacterium]